MLLLCSQKPQLKQQDPSVDLAQEIILLITQNPNLNDLSKVNLSGILNVVTAVLHSCQDTQKLCHFLDLQYTSISPLIKQLMRVIFTSLLEIDQ